MGQLGREAGRCSPAAVVVGVVGADDVGDVVAGDILVAAGGAAVAAGSDVVHVVVVVADEAAVDEAVVVVGTAFVVDLYIAVVAAAAVVVVVVVLDVAGKIFVVSAAFVGTACQSHIPRRPLVTPHAAGPD